MKTSVLAFFLLAGVLAVSLPVSAHHGNAAYDESKDVILKDATVTKFAWANPHCLISFDVKDDKGNVAHWVGELGSPSALTLVGFSKASVQPGDVITIHIHQSKVNNVVGRISRIVFQDGTSLPKPSDGASPYRNGETPSY